MSDRLLDLYNQQIVASVAGLIRNHGSIGAELGSNVFGPSNNYQDSFNGDTASDRMLVLGAAIRTDDNPNPVYTRTTPYDKVPNNNTLRFTTQQPPKNLVPQEGQVYGNDFYGGNQYNDKQPFAPMAQHAQGIGVTDIFAIANWARNIAQEFGIIARPGDTANQQAANVAKGIQFASTQFLLAAMNPGDPQYGGVLNMIYNPLSLPLSAVPFTRVSTTIGSPTIAAALSVTGRAYTQYSSKLGDVGDRHLLMRQGVYQKMVNGTDLAQLNIPTPGFIGDAAATGETNNLQNGGGIPSLVNGLPIEAQVDQSGLAGKLAQFSNFHTNTYTADSPYDPYGINSALDQSYVEQEMLSKKQTSGYNIAMQALFKDDGASALKSLQSLLPPGAKPIVDFGQNSTKYTWQAGPNKKLRGKSIPIVPEWEAGFGYGELDGTSPVVIPEADNYFPFWFQDLRSTTSTYLNFRAFLNGNIEETFTPRWNGNSYYGRSEEVATYQSTSRNLSLNFDVVAWGPSELKDVWAKLHKLQSMVYPSYDNEFYMQSGPLIRMRVGDLFAADSFKGLPGFITSLSFSYDDGIWNLEIGQKVPRKIRVSLGFTVVHEGNPGVFRMPGILGTFFGAGSVQKDVANQEVVSADATRIRGINSYALDTPTYTVPRPPDPPPIEVVDTQQVDDTAGTGAG